MYFDNSSVVWCGDRTALFGVGQDNSEMRKTLLFFVLNKVIIT